MPSSPAGGPRHRNRTGSCLERCTPEQAVASTKAFTNMVASLLLFAIRIGRTRSFSREKGQSIIKDFEKIPEQMERYLANPGPIDEAVELSNNSRFGLGVSIFSEDIEAAEKLSYRFNEGAVFINELVKSDPRLPFGGVKESGYGRELSKHGIREFMNRKTIYINK